MIPLAKSLGKRGLADSSRIWCARLAAAAVSCSVTDVERDSRWGPSSTHLNHTPSPQGQYDTAPFVLPRFFGLLRRGAGIIKTASGAEHLGRSGVGSAKESRQGTVTCPSRRFPSPLPFARALRPAATHWANRRLAVQPSARVPQPSPAAALHRVQPSVPQATLPTASSIPADVTDQTPRARALTPRRTRSSHPARHLPLRGFCIHSKTQKDATCSRKS